MNKLVVCTQAYQAELKGLLCQNTIFREEKNGNLHTIEFGYDVFDAKGFLQLLRKIIINGNAVAKRSPAIEEHVSRLAFPDMERKLLCELLAYVAENSVLHLEGYAHFRMWEYEHHLNLILYSIVKRLYF